MFKRLLWHKAIILFIFIKSVLQSLDAAAVEECLKRIQAAKGVSGVVVVGPDGNY